MNTKDKLLALCVVIIWGVNFVVIKFGLDGVPPFLLGGLRFLFVLFPAILFVPRPKVPMKLLIMYGLAMNFGQFAFLFSAIKLGMPAGLASLVLQSQAFFTLLLCALFFREKIKLNHLLGITVAGIGITVLAMGQASAANITAIGFMLTLCAALSWASGNVVNKQIGRVSQGGSAFSVVVWSAAIPILPFFACSYLFEGSEAITHSLMNLNLKSAFSIAYLSFAASILGYSIWGNLLSRYETWRVAPLTLLVPIVGLATAWIILGETLSIAQTSGAVLVMVGLLINIFGALIKPRRPHFAKK
ncbi:EamA family transporter [Pragia fontium]|uniref:O-acetylserine/cysteine efflux transporter n=1 Tax=Pragia fontium DSM 5563 = ATCC 49100 TaxID=1122977 RepID=A0AAJ4WAL2_9GAMM|nr:EamA family transporter [Pragia fontium]AKJ42333.1 acetylserine transporter [Pragia fontium]SFC81750.1 O-acetylserine/cysteine efflux transporter [Pragia fontium DSM 5563 = ATCC 49100]SUB82625.1 Probable amino-acid metabolite efflux pump [Pragia fontium]VEJ55526.1 Probable amino-acid metabolite efflux pump [Pragia fontium]